MMIQIKDDIIHFKLILIRPSATDLYSHARTRAPCPYIEIPKHLIRPSATFFVRRARLQPCDCLHTQQGNPKGSPYNGIEIPIH